MNATVSARAKTWLAGFTQALAAGPAAAAEQFHEDCYWRDFLAFTWNLTTQAGRPAIAAMLEATLTHAPPTAWRIEGEATRPCPAGGVRWWPGRRAAG
jgi:putative flavoprotein involved in K+ transport